jgi:fructoselysine 6-kinase
MVRILGIGDNTVDIYLTEGMQYPGGNAVNVAVQTRRCGAQASYLGCLGRDMLGDLVFESLIAEDVDVSHVRRIDGPSPWSRIRHEDGDRIFAGSNPGVRDRYDLTAADDTFIAAHDMVHTSVHSGLDGQMERLKSRAHVLSYDYSEHWERPSVADTMRFVDIAFLSGAQRDAEACSALAQWCASQGPRIVVITRGRHGAMTLVEGHVVTAPAYPATVVDTLGAGDGFIAAFLVAHGTGMPIRQCLDRGMRKAGAVCASKGGFGHGVPIVPGQPGLDPSTIVRRADAPTDQTQQKGA